MSSITFWGCMFSGVALVCSFPSVSIWWSFWSAQVWLSASRAPLLLISIRSYLQIGHTSRILRIIAVLQELFSG